MESNFDIFPEEWEYLANLGKVAEKNLFQDPNTSLVKLRLYTEEMTKAIFNLEKLNFSERDTQLKKLSFLRNEDFLSNDIAEIFHTIRKIGNKAAHNGQYGSTDEADKMLNLAFYLGCWFMEVYVSYDFSPPAYTQPINASVQLMSKVSELENLIYKQQFEFNKNLKLINKISMSAADRENRHKRSKNYTNQYPLNEAQTRVLIDQQLRTAGWECDTNTLNYKTKKTMPKKNQKIAIAEWKCGNLWADYALFDDLKLVGVVEAKKYSKDVLGDMVQAKRYANTVEKIDGIELLFPDAEYKVPFIYATNGRPYLKQLKEKSGIWFWDSRNPYQHDYPLESWHSPKDLRQKLVVNEEKANKELEVEVYPDFADRYYQIDAIKAVEQALVENKRRMLLAMATGTGKTRTALSLMYRLIKTKRVRRILFLVDRTALGTQAADALKDTKIDNLSFSDIYDVKEVTDAMPEDDTKIQIATVQGMVHRLFNSDDKEIPSVGQYDFIIVDEAHRGYTEDKEMTDSELEFTNQNEYVSQYRRVIDYFDAAVLGLTATPALHTTQIFDSPIYTYSYTDAVIDGYLVDHEPPYKFETELSKNGIIFEKNKEVEFWNSDTQNIDKAYMKDELSFDVESFNKKVITKQFNRAILDRLTEHIDPNNNEKTLIFAATDNHADLIVRMLKEIYTEKGVLVEQNAIEKITGSVYKVADKIKCFKNERFPSIVVTVDLLTTGIDVPEICNLVFLRRVRSRILYDQMLGRATRLCSEIGKESFKIFDAVHLYDDLQEITDMKPVVKNPNVSVEELLEVSLEAGTEDQFDFFKMELIAKLQRKKQSLSDSQKNEIQELSQITSIDKWLLSLKTLNQEELRQQAGNINHMIRSKKSHYPMYISKHKDQLLEEIRGYGTGNEKPSDYLNSFNTFIRENLNLIPALQILVAKPKDLTRADLREIILKLKESNYDETSLQIAWKSTKNETVTADIISFIRQAAIGSPLVDHDLRIKQAMKKVYNLTNWTSNQTKWLERIEKQLLQTSILAPTAEEAFTQDTIYVQNGGYKQMKLVFKENLDEIVDLINENLYA